MKNTLNFLLEVGKLKDIKRKGITFYGVKNPDSTTDHIFRMAMMAWLFGKKSKYSHGKILKLALIHDISKVYTGDITPYDGLLPQDKKEIRKFAEKWRRISLIKKEKMFKQKFNKEYKAIQKLTSKLPKETKKEMMNLWLDYYKLGSSEAKFVHQLDVLENLIEAFECSKKNKKFPTYPWWERAEEVVDNPILLGVLKEIGKEELKK